jgi:hypothetical protein
LLCLVYGYEFLDNKKTNVELEKETSEKRNKNLKNNKFFKMKNKIKPK